MMTDLVSVCGRSSLSLFIRSELFVLGRGREECVREGEGEGEGEGGSV